MSAALLAVVGAVFAGPLFLLAAFLLGLAVLSVFRIRLLAEERFVFSLVVGSTFSIWLAYILALWQKSITDTLILCASALFLLLSFPLLALSKGKLEMNIDKKTSLFLVSVLFYVIVMNLYCVFRPDSEGNLHAMLSVWGDYPLHTSIITSFAYGNNFPPVHPLYLGKQMEYPFLMDFLSAILLLSFDLRMSILLPNIIFQWCLFASFFFLSLRLTKNYTISALSFVFFILAGYPLGLEKQGLNFLNPVYAVILPQRSAILGLCISFIVYSLLFSAFFEQNEENSTKREWQKRKKLLLSGILMGLLPRIHAHSFIVTAFVSLFLSIFAITSQRKCKSEIKFELFNISFLFIPLILLAFPQVLAIRTQVSEEFFVFYPGWVDNNRDMILKLDWSGAFAIISFFLTLFIMLKFWIMNLNVLSFLIPLGFFTVSRDVRAFYTPFFLVFAIGNIVKFQPWWWDNYKLLLHWFALSAILAAFALHWLCQRARMRLSARAEAKKSAKRRISASVFLALLISATFFGVVTHVAMFTIQPTVFTPADFDVAVWVRENTPPNSIFLVASSAHNHPIPSLAGRQVVLGYEGWLWSHGFNWSEIQMVKRDEIKIFSGELPLLSKYNINYVCVGPHEENFARINRFKINISAFNDALDLKYERVFYVNGRKVQWRIYKVR